VFWLTFRVSQVGAWKIRELGKSGSWENQGAWKIRVKLESNLTNLKNGDVKKVQKTKLLEDWQRKNISWKRLSI
jgi:SPX domain protein involved in polyphosphate accumulation